MSPGASGRGRTSLGLRRLTGCLAVGLAAALANAPQAGASAFYNNTDDDGFPATFSIHLNCGIFCHNTWTLRPGQSASRPGKGGDFLLDVPGKACDDYTPHHPPVQDHGWAEIRAHSATSKFWSIFGSNQQHVGDYDIIWRADPPGRIPTPAMCSMGQ